MQIAGLGVRDVMGVVREARDAAGHAALLVVTGMLSNELARALRGGAEHGGSIRVGDDLDGAAAAIVVLGSAPTGADEHAMRTAARASILVVAF